jgi:hypothetical protein
MLRITAPRNSFIWVTAEFELGKPLDPEYVEAECLD